MCAILRTNVTFTPIRSGPDLDILAEDLNGSLWVAAVEKRRLVGLEVDPIQEIVRWGSVYMARVTRIDAAMNAAFLDLGYEQNGIIFAHDILLDDGKKPPKGKKIGTLLRSGQMIAVQVKQAVNPTPDLVKDLPLSEKSSRVSMDIALPGRHLIYTPLSQETRVSRRVTNPTLRANMQAMVRDIDSIKGCILRASAANCQTDVLIRESKILHALWDSLKNYLKPEDDEPALIMMGPDAIQRILADHAVEKTGRIAISTMEQFQDVEDWCELYAPDLVTKIDPASEDESVIRLGLFESYGIIEDIDSLLRPYIFLKNGGNMIIQTTAALTAIDVNQGADKSIVSTNTDAAIEATRQIRLRNLGGIILIDFINMSSKKDRDKILALVKTEVARDPCTVDVHGWTKTGLMELTRARRTPPLKERFELSDFDS